MTFVFTDHEKQFGWGKARPERLATPGTVVAESQDWIRNGIPTRRSTPLRRQVIDSEKAQLRRISRRAP